MFGLVAFGTDLGAKQADHAHDVLATDRTLAEHFATIGASGDVAALENDAFDWCVHADLAEIVARHLVDGCA